MIRITEKIVGPERNADGKTDQGQRKVKGCHVTVGRKKAGVRMTQKGT